MSEDGWTKITIRDLLLDLQIGVNDDEKGRTQPVIVSLEATIERPRAGDRLETTVSYDPVVRGIRRLAEEAHIGLVETLAEKIAALCLADSRIRDVTVSVEKTQVYDFPAIVGTRLFRSRS